MEVLIFWRYLNFLTTLHRSDKKISPIHSAVLIELQTVTDTDTDITAAVQTWLGSWNAGGM